MIQGFVNLWHKMWNFLSDGRFIVVQEKEKNLFFLSTNTFLGFSVFG